MSLITGTGKSIFQPFTGRSTTAVEIPLTNSGRGLKETYTPLGKTHELLSYSLATRIDGWKINFEFGFDDYVKGTTLMKFKSILNGMQSGARYWLHPRSDNMIRKYEVSYVKDNFDILLERGGTFHKGFKITFITTDKVDSLDWEIFVAPTVMAVCLEDVATI